MCVGISVWVWVCLGVSVSVCVSVRVDLNTTCCIHDVCVMVCKCMHIVYLCI